MNEYGFIVVLLISVVYYTLIVWFTIGIKRLPKFELEQEVARVGFSIIIAFRNEEENLERLLQSIAQINYPKDLFEIVLVDDSSSDASKQIIEDFIAEHKQIDIHLLENERKSNSPKKDAINTAIQVSNYDWILTTDADCEVSEHWLVTYSSFILKNKPIFIAGIVTYQNQKGFLHQFQQLDWISLIGVTMGSFGWNKALLCSGANIAYQKKAFYQVKGFEGNEHIASGDDIFLMQKMQKDYPNKIFYLNSKQAVVQTKSVATWKELFQQRIRWAKKTSSMSNPFIKQVGLSVFLFNLSLIILLLLTLIDPLSFSVFIILFVVKILIDSILIIRIKTVLNQKIKIFYWFLSSLLYPFFSIGIVLLSIFIDYNWKNRTFKK